jgi:hypothetical protein
VVRLSWSLGLEGGGVEGVIEKAIEEDVLMSKVVEGRSLKLYIFLSERGIVYG